MFSSENFVNDVFDHNRHTEELVPVRVLETLPIDSLRRSGGLPSEVPYISVTTELDLSRHT